MDFPITALNQLFIEKAEKPGGAYELAKVSQVFITSRLSFDGMPKPEVTCDFRMEADLLKWRFIIKREGTPDTAVGVEMTTQMLMATDKAVSYLLEQAVRKELGLPELPPVVDLHAKPVIEP